MAKSTAGVRKLVEDVLNNISVPYSEDITDEVCQAIEGNPDLHKRYDLLTKDLKEQWLVNNWIGKYTMQMTGLRSQEQVKAKSTLIATYKKLR